MIAANGVANLREVAGARRGHDGRQRRHGVVDARGYPAGPHVGDTLREGAEETVHAGVAEARCGAGEDRHGVGVSVELHPVPLHLLGNILAGIFGATLIGLVDGNEVGIVEHLNLLELRRRTELGRHHIERDVAEFGHLGVALADARSLEQDEVVAGERENPRAIFRGLRQRPVGLPRGKRTHEDAVVKNSVHPDAVAEQRTTGTLAGRVDADDADAELRVGTQEAPYQFVCERRLARSARAGDAHHNGPKPRLRRRGLEPFAPGNGSSIAVHRSLDHRLGPGQPACDGRLGQPRVNL